MRQLDLFKDTILNRPVSETLVCVVCKVKYPIVEFFRRPVSRGGYFDCNRCCSKRLSEEFGLLSIVKCKVCKLEKPIYDFELSELKTREREGRTGYRSQRCRDCSKIRKQKQIGKRRLLLLKQEKLQDNNEKWCSGCDAIKNLAEFTENPAYSGGYSPRCTVCNSLQYRKAKYGITPKEYIERFQSLGGRCQICHVKFESLISPHVDHCHKSGEVRGLLCETCNYLLGNSKDDVFTLIRAALYLNAGRTRRLIKRFVKHCLDFSWVPSSSFLPV